MFPGLLFLKKSYFQKRRESLWGRTDRCLSDPWTIKEKDTEHQFSWKKIYNYDDNVNNDDDDDGEEFIEPWFTDKKWAPYF